MNGQWGVRGGRSGGSGETTHEVTTFFSLCVMYKHLMSLTSYFSKKEYYPRLS